MYAIEEGLYRSTCLDFAIAVRQPHWPHSHALFSGHLHGHHTRLPPDCIACNLQKLANAELMVDLIPNLADLFFVQADPPPRSLSVSSMTVSFLCD